MSRHTGTYTYGEEDFVLKEATYTPLRRATELLGAGRGLAKLFGQLRIY